MFESERATSVEEVEDSACIGADPNACNDLGSPLLRRVGIPKDEKRASLSARLVLRTLNVSGEERS